METSIKPKILFLPAWWPCSFFEEQQQVYSDEYDIVNLIGNVNFDRRRNILNSLFQKQVVDKPINNKFIELSISWYKLKDTKNLNRQFAKLVQLVGDKVTSWLGNQKPAILHIQSVSDISVFVAYWAQQNHVPIILTEHILYIRRQFDYFTKKKESLYSISDKVYCVSNYLLRNLITNGFRLRQSKVIGNLVKVPKNHVILERNQRNGRVMFVAGHLHDKEIQVLFDVSELLKSKNIEVDIYGLSGNEKYSQENTVAEELSSRSISNVHLKGKYSHDQLLEQYSPYSVLLSTSVSETFGLVVAEAIANGVPVVCTDSGGIRDFVNESNGLIVDIRDVKAIVNAISLTLHSNEYDLISISNRIIEKYGYTSYRYKVLNG